MPVLHIFGRDESRAWTDWNGRGFRKKCLADGLKKACPSLRLTDRKRLAQKLSDGLETSITIESPESFRYIAIILDATGILYRVDEGVASIAETPPNGQTP